MGDNKNVFSPEQAVYQQGFSHQFSGTSEEIKEDSKSKQMKYETPAAAQQRISCSDSLFEGSFNSNPTGREMLVSRAEKIMEEYHG